MADQGPPSGESPEAQPPTDQSQSGWPSRPPPSPGQPPMTVTRSRLGTGRGPAGQRPPAPRPAPPIEPAEVAPATTPEPAAPQAAPPAPREAAQEQLASEMGEQA